MHKSECCTLRYQQHKVAIDGRILEGSLYYNTHVYDLDATNM